MSFGAWSIAVSLLTLRYPRDRLRRAQKRFSEHENDPAAIAFLSKLRADEDVTPEPRVG
jgi:hypothetical protein